MPPKTGNLPGFGGIFCYFSVVDASALSDLVCSRL